MSSTVEVTRGGVVESRHAVHVAVAHATRGLIFAAGDRENVSFVRSAIKMFQALPLVEDGVAAAYGFTPQELALCTASHNAERKHVDAARRMLEKSGSSEHDLACGPHAPMYEPAADALKAEGAAPTRLHNNCSGKHAGMLALAQFHGWTTAGYHQLAHPVQQRILRTLATWSDIQAETIATAVDGCGLPTFSLPLKNVAMACARFAAAANDRAPAATLVSAMTTHPDFVAGTGRLCTVLMQQARGRVFAKVGAEGYYCAGVPEQGIGIALKIADGARRASEPALLAVLRTLDAISQNDTDALREFAHPQVLNTRGELVGDVRARIDLTAVSD
jgi:L-asparaginase II